MLNEDLELNKKRHCLTNSDLEKRIDLMKAITTSFNGNSSKYDQLLELAFKIALDDNMTENLKNIQVCFHSLTHSLTH